MMVPGLCLVTNLEPLLEFSRTNATQQGETRRVRLEWRDSQSNECSGTGYVLGHSNRGVYVLHMRSMGGKDVDQYWPLIVGPRHIWIGKPA